MDGGKNVQFENTTYIKCLIFSMLHFNMTNLFQFSGILISTLYQYNINIILTYSDTRNVEELIIIAKQTICNECFAVHSPKYGGWYICANSPICSNRWCLLHDTYDLKWKYALYHGESFDNQSFENVVEKLKGLKFGPYMEDGFADRMRSFTPYQRDDGEDPGAVCRVCEEAAKADDAAKDQQNADDDEDEEEIQSTSSSKTNVRIKRIGSDSSIITEKSSSRKITSKKKQKRKKRKNDKKSGNKAKKSRQKRKKKTSISYRCL